MNAQKFFNYFKIFFESLLKKSQNTFDKNLLGFSGGQDSTFLFIYIFMSTLMHNRAYAILHLNHLIQKDNFYYTLNNYKLAFLFNTKYHFCIPFKRLNNESISCLWRYSIFFRISNFYIYKYICLGHSNTDYCEKFFLNLFRGCGNFSSSFLKFKTKFYINKYCNFFYNWQ